MPSRHRGSIVFGVVIIILGIIWLVNNLGIYRVDIGSLIATFWPVILVLWGLELIVRRLQTSDQIRQSVVNYLDGALLILLGFFILGNNVGLYNFNFSILWNIIWPVIVILIGVSLLRNNGSGGRHWAVMSGIELKNKGWKLEDGNYLALMGGIKMDLLSAEIPEREVQLNFQAIMGGIDIIVPQDLNVVCHGTSLLGGLNFMREESGGIIASRSFESPGTPGSAKKLVVQANVIMGGITVKREVS